MCTILDETTEILKWFQHIGIDYLDESNRQNYRNVQDIKKENSKYINDVIYIVP